MTYRGHIENGVIVLDEPTHLKEGARVRVDLVEVLEPASDQTPLRGSDYVYAAPFSPAVPPEDWEVTL